MKNIKEEKVLLYNFTDKSYLENVCKVFASLHIKTVILKETDFCQKIGYLLNLTGFTETQNTIEDDFDFNYEVLIFYNIKNKRLDDVLSKLKNADIIIPYKAVVTPLNRFWSLKRLCFNMQKEHSALIEQKEKQEKNEQ